MTDIITKLQFYPNEGLTDFEIFEILSEQPVLVSETIENEDAIWYHIGFLIYESDARIVICQNFSKHGKIIPKYIRTFDKSKVSIMRIHVK